MPKPPSALTPENLDFCTGVRAFCDEQGISVRRLADMCASAQVRFSKTEASRLLHAQATDAVIERIRPHLAPAFVAYLEGRGYTADEIDQELSHIFDPKEFTTMIANRCPSSPEAQRHFGLKFDPFDVDHLPTAGEIYTNDELDNVVARLKDAVHFRRFVSVIGGVGTGKTLLKLRLAHELNEDTDKPAHLLYPEFFDMEEVTVHGIANKILAELGQKIPQNKEARVTRIREVLTQMQQEGIGVAIVLDECHRLRDKVISSLKNFWEMTNGRSSRLLGVILFGQPSFVDARLRDVKFKEIRQRVQIIQMPAFSSEISNSRSQIDLSASSASSAAKYPAAEYISHRLHLAGGMIDQLFDEKAIERICLNAPTPLSLGNITNEALMHAYALEETRVTASMEFFKKLSTGQQVLGMRRTAA